MAVIVLTTECMVFSFFPAVESRQNNEMNRPLASTLLAVFFSSLVIHGSEQVPVLLAEGDFQDSGNKWKQDSWDPKKATIVTEGGERFASITVPKGFGTEIFTEAKIPADCAAIKVKFRTRCHHTADPDRPSIMVQFGTGQKHEGKPLQLNPNGAWEWHEVVVRFRPRPDNDEFSIVSLSSPLSVDIDDITISLPTPEEAKPPLPKEGPNAQTDHS